MLVLPLLLVIACSSQKEGEDAARRDVALRNGQVKFMQFCQKCHPDGEAGLGPSLTLNPAPRFLIAFQVRHGLGAMPAFTRNRISKPDLHDITLYVKELRHKHKKEK